MYPGNPTAASSGLFKLLESIESCELEAYPDPHSPLGEAATKLKLHVRDYRRVPGWEQLSGSPWTAGMGHTGPEVKPGLKVTRAQCEDWLHKDTQYAASVVTRLVTVPLTQNQFDALVSFVFNVGEGTPERKGFKQSTLLVCLNKKNYADAAKEFRHWRKAQGRVSGGLVKRRKLESELFATPDPVVLADDTNKET